MSYDAWKTRTPDHLQPHDMPHRPDHTCRKCRARDTEVWHHTHLGVECDACFHIATEAAAANPVFARR